MARLIAALIRHGDYRQLADTPSAHQPFALNRRGREQAQAAVAGICDWLQQQQLQLDPVIDSSCLLRGWETAQILAEGLQDAGWAAHVESFDDLAERGLGSAANLSTAQIREVIEQDPRYDSLPQDWKSNSHYCLPLQGAESLMMAGERVAAHLRRRMEGLKAEEGGDRLKLFVGHGAAFRHAAYCLDALAFEQIAALSMYHVQPVYLQYQPQDGWRHVGGDWKVRAAHSEYKD